MTDVQNVLRVLTYPVRKPPPLPFPPSPSSPCSDLQGYNFSFIYHSPSTIRRVPQALIDGTASIPTSTNSTSRVSGYGVVLPDGLVQDAEAALQASTAGSKC
jgi:hypothetical protein